MGHPLNTNLYVVNCIFNPFNFQSRYRLYGHFKKHMEDSGAKLFTVEVAFGDRPFKVTTPDNPMNLQLRTNHILWHKERALNLGFKKLFHVVPDSRYLGFFDADITFAHPEWVSEATHKLSHLSIIQPYATAINLNSQDDYMWHCPSTIRAYIDGRGFHQHPPMPIHYIYKGHPGLAWCIRRDAYEAIGGLYDKCVAGSGDTVMANALKGDWSAYLPAHPSKRMEDMMAEWQQRTDRHIRSSLGYAPGCLLHHWHGPSEKRGYEKRWSILSYHQFDPVIDLVEDDGGLYKWAGNKPQLEDDIRLSLSSRNEDQL